MERKRSRHYYNAKDCFEKIADLGVLDPKDFKPVVSHFGFWWRKYNKGVFVHLCKDEKHIYIRAVNRFMEKYKRYLKKRLFPLRFVRFSIKIELTIDPKKFMRLSDEFKAITKAWCRLRAYMYKMYGKFQFLRILEITKAGRPLDRDWETQF